MATSPIDLKIYEILSLKEGDVLTIGERRWELAKSFDRQLWLVGKTIDTPTVSFQLFEILNELGGK
jgi:hypothetical protein